MNWARAQSHNGGQPGRLHGLDTLRALAILIVMPYHLSEHFPDLLEAPSHFGWIGVDLFFVLSGFLIGMQLFRPYLRSEPPRLAEFYRRRAFRILPAFAVVLLLYVFVPLWREAPGLQPWWQFATFTENFVIDYGHNQAFSHAWSLCVEEHFYLFLPLLTVVLMRRPSARNTVVLLAALVLAGVLLRGYVLFRVFRPLGDGNFGLLYLERLYYPTYTRLDGLIAGVSLALIRTFRPAWWARITRHGHILTVAGLGAIALELWCSTTRFKLTTGKAVVNDLFGFPLLALGFALLTASAVSKNGWLARTRVPGAQLLATLAFSLYLTHKEAVHLLLHWFPQLPDGTFRVQPLLFGVCLCCAGALYLGVERPFLLLRDRTRQHRARPGAVDTEARLDPAI